jgi:DNA-binding transcriptional regulator YiaG
MILGDKIRLIRETMKLKQVEFAELFRHGQSMISSWETGTRIPTHKDLSILARLAKRYRVDVELL